MDMMRPQSIAYPPFAPTGLTLTDNGDGTATLDWNDNSIAETAYAVQVSTDGVNWAEVGRIDVPLTAGPNSTGPMSFVLATFASGDQYKVVAENTVGDTFDYANPNINEIGTTAAPGTGFPHITTTSVSDIVVVGTPAPAAPTGLTATLDAAVPQVDLAWTDNATSETGYVVERSDNGDPFAVITTTPLTVDTVAYADTTVTFGNTYEYQVAAVNGAVQSGYSNVALVDWTGSAPAAPTNLGATVASATQVDLTWTDNAINETGYDVERSDDGVTFAVVATLPADAVTYSDPTVGVGNGYTYRVAATNLTGTSGYSNEASVTLTLPDAPINLSATSVTRTGFTLNWEYPFAQPDGFEIQVATNAGFSSIEQSFPDVNADQTSLDVSQLTRNKNYAVRIRAFDAVGVGVWSTTLQVRTAR
jgi:fibronectin type 3 domain-containing protein